MLISASGLPNKNFISSSQPSTAVCVLDESLFIRFVVVEIAETNGRRLDLKLSRLTVCCNLEPFRGDKPCGIPGQE
jgi:hypothetical protein